MQNKYDVIVVGAGAAGLMAAIEAGKRGRRVLLIEKTNKIGEKIRISGGGRCNFTNLNITPQCYISQNTKFAISALKNYTQHDFINLVEKYSIKHHEKTLGQLFCDGSAMQIIEMLIDQCRKYQVDIKMQTDISNISKNVEFQLSTNYGLLTAQSLIIATGGLAIPKISTDFGYRIAQQFGLNIIDTYPALVPLTLNGDDLILSQALSGIAIFAIVAHHNKQFRENILFTHRGLSGPAILQISSYLAISTAARELNINLLPNIKLHELFIEHKNSKILLGNFLREYLPKRFIDNDKMLQHTVKTLTEYRLSDLHKIADYIHNYKLAINGDEGYLKAEVTGGGIDTAELSSKTMAAHKVKNLYFIGELVDVTGWLGGYNFQWAWASGYAAGNYA